MQKREFQFEEGTSRKFWSVSTEGADLIVHFGRIGTTGQAQKKTLADAAAAEKEANKLIAEKTKKGYAEVAAGTATGGTAPVVVAAPKREPKASPPVAPPPPAEEHAQASPAPRPAAAAAPPAPAPSTLQRTLRLEPSDHFVRTWEEHTPLVRGPEVPFDRKDGLARLEKIGRGREFYYYDWSHGQIPDWPSAEEAEFWLRAWDRVHAARRGTTASKVAQEFARDYPVAPLDEEAILAHFGNYFGRDALAACSARLLSPEQLLALDADAHPEAANALGTVFRQTILPYLTTAERAHLCSLVSSLQITRPSQSSGHSIGAWPTGAWLQAALGRHAQVESVLGTLPDKCYAPDPNRYSREEAQWLVFGLGSPERVRAEFSRLALTLQNEEQVRAWLALTGFSALEEIARSTCIITTKDAALAFGRLLLRVQAPEAAGPALRINLDSKAPLAGLEWLQAYPLEAVVGMVPLALGTGALAQAARAQLKFMHGAGTIPANVHDFLPADHSAWLRSNVQDTAEDRLPVATRQQLPGGLHAAFDDIKGIKPTSIPAAALPAIRLGDTRLAPEEIAALLHVLKSASLEAPPPLAAALKAHAEANSLDQFAWRIFEVWQSLGAPSKEKWALQAVGLLGGDDCVLRLTPLIRAWPGESQHQRAVVGLQVLRTIGSDTALMALNGIAQKLKFKALQEKAKALMEEIAASRGLSREQLADRIVPDCDLDARGSRTFDFGARQFTFVLGPEMKPLVRDAAGKVRPDLPAPNAGDDPGRSAAAVSEWKLLKKTLREVLKIQAERLEDAMIAGRRWSTEEFRTLLVGHPLMINLARQLVFGACDEAGQVVQTFRVTEDQTLADAQDETVLKISTERVGIVHPAHLDTATLGAWGQVLADYEIIPPFPQLGRPICQPEPGDLELVEITRYKGPKIPGIVMYGMLERSHWLRDTPADGGGFHQHSKYFPAAEVTAFIGYEPGLAMGYYEETQELTEIYFVPGHVKPEWWGQHDQRLKVKDVDRVVMSEVLRLANAIVAKAES